MPPFNSIDGMGASAAEAFVEAAAQGKFLSLEDMRTRSKAPQKVIDKLVEWGVVQGLPATNQLSLFDFC